MDQVKLLPAIILFILFFGHELCCSPIRGQDSAVSTPTTGGRVPTTEYPVRNSIDGTSLTCPDSYQQYYCLNGAKCFLVNTGISYEYNCECTNGFLGHRCQFKHATSVESPDKEYSDDND